MFLRLLELVFLIGGIWAIVTQIFFPAIRGTQVFPMFRREAKLVEELVEANQQVREKKLEDSIVQAKKELQPTQEKSEERPGTQQQQKTI
jgi:hypothetical protein